MAFHFVRFDISATHGQNVAKYVAPCSICTNSPPADDVHQDSIQG